MTTPCQKPKIAMIAGFGDNAGMYEDLRSSTLAQTCELIPLNLPGFGALPLEGTTTLTALAQWLSDEMQRQGARIVVAHSVASIIASLAASTTGSPVTHIISLEGNLTAEDAYFSGRAAEHFDPVSFRDWFLPRLAHKAQSDPILARYAREVAKADAQALWELGCDARAFSDKCHPGEMLRDAGKATYVINPDNCAKASLDWLKASGLSAIELPGASHWPSIDQPEELAKAIETALG